MGFQKSDICSGNCAPLSEKLAISPLRLYSLYFCFIFSTCQILIYSTVLIELVILAVKIQCN